MLTDAGCRARRAKLFGCLPEHIRYALITEPAHLMYFANFWQSPFTFHSQGAPAALLLERDGEAILFADSIQAPFAEAAFVTERVAPVWYRCVESAPDRRGLLQFVVLDYISRFKPSSIAFEALSCPGDLLQHLRHSEPQVDLFDLDVLIRDLRRIKHADEVALLRDALRAAEAGLAAARKELRPGMTELELYQVVWKEATSTLGKPAVIYGDFASGPRTFAGGGAATARVIAAGDPVLLDFSVIVGGYRGDFAATFVCDGQPNARLREFHEICLEALGVAEAALKPDVTGRDVDLACRQVFRKHGVEQCFPHHTGHGVGLGHPDPPYLVSESSDTLTEGDVVTLEPGLYEAGVAGIRIEHVYLVTEHGAERLSGHSLALEQRG